MDVTMYHNPACSTCRTALADLTERGANLNLVQYLKTPPTEAELRQLLSIFADDPKDLVRKDPLFKSLGLTDADIQTEDDIIQLLLAHPRLMQRPVVVIDGRAYLGRPKGRIAELLANS